MRSLQSYSPNELARERELLRGDGEAVTSGQVNKGTASAAGGVIGRDTASGVPSIVRPENLEFRDGDLSIRHRLWGFDCPAVDLDLLMVEYNNGKAAALVEYKFAASPTPNPNLGHPTMRAVAGLANDSGIPFIVAFYTRDPWTFRVFRGNAHACRIYKTDGRLLTEREFVESLYFIRNRALDLGDQEWLDALDDKREAA